MPSRRRFLAAVGAACAVGIAGCGNQSDSKETPSDSGEDTPTRPPDHDPTTPPNVTPTPESGTETATPTPDDSESAQPEGVLNVLDYGAVGDGKRNDVRAIQSAVNDAEDGDTIYVPSGEYFVARENSDLNAMITIPSDVSDLTIRGTPGYGNTRIFMGKKEYATDRNVDIFRAKIDYNVIDGLEIRDLTLDGNRPDGIETNKPSSFAIHFWPSGAGGGHDIRIEDCWVENFNGPAITCREGGDVVFNRITSVNNAQNFGVSEEDDSTVGTGEYGITIKNSISKNATLVGIDHNRGGRVKLENIYSANNGNSGWKTKPDNRETRLVNCTFENENYLAALRTNIDDSREIPDPPVEISIDSVAIRNPQGAGIYLSGDTSEIKNTNISGGPIEIRNSTANGGNADGAMTIHAPSGGSIGELRIIGTRDGPGLWYAGDYDLDIDKLYHADNDEGPVMQAGGGGELSITKRQKTDPGPLMTPDETEVGAWAHPPLEIFD